MRPVSVAGIVLAAGFSRRLGRAKQEIVLGNRTLLESAVLTSLAADLSPVIAVVRDPRWGESLQLLGAAVCLNQEAGEGMASSVRAGIRAVSTLPVEGAVILTCDQPLLHPNHLRALAANSSRITGSAYAGRTGVPAYFPASTFPSLLELQGDQGARALLRNAAAITNENLSLDIDTEEDLHRAQQHLDIPSH